MKRETAIPVLFVQARKLSGNEALKALRDAVPEAADLLDETIQKGSGVILIDGLDELSSEAWTSETALIPALVAHLPKSVKIGLSCRSTMTDLVARMLGERALTVELQNLSEEQVQAMLDTVQLASGAIPPNLRQPLIVRLLDLQSADSQVVGVTELPDLYERSLQAIIAPELRRFPELKSVSTSAVFGLLTDATAEMFDADGTRLDSLRKSWLGKTEFTSLMNSLISVGVLSLDSSDVLTFGHKSLFDYFYARLLERDLFAWDASHLSRSNLIYDYHVNRFLVPMLLRRPPLPANDAARTIRGQLFPGGRSETKVCSKLVSRSQFRCFIAKTGWRRETGFGQWRQLVAPDGTLATVGMVPFDGEALTATSGDDDEPVSGVSWYDAQQFAWWLGMCLPSQREAIPPASTMFLWTSSWHDEPKALMRLAHDDSKVPFAANPDVRSSRIGFCVR